MIRSAIYTFFLLLFIACPHIVIAQTGSPEFVFDHIRGSARKPINNAWGLMKDRQGFLWMGGLEGLQVFDGFTTQSFTTSDKDSNSIKDNGVARIVQDNLTDGLWVGTTQALNYFDRRRAIFQKYYPGSKADEPSFVMPYCIDHNNKLWLFSGNAEGICVFDTKSKVTSLVCQSDEIAEFYPGIPNTKQLFALVANTNGGLTKLEFSDYKLIKKQIFFSKNDPNGLPSLIFSGNFWIANDSIAWLGADTGLVEFNFKSFSYRVFNRLVDNTSILNVKEVSPIRGNYLLAGTSDHGLLVFDIGLRQFVKQYQNNPNDPLSISSNTIGEILPDSNGNVFIVTARKGIDIVHLNNKVINLHFSNPIVSENGKGNQVSALLKINDSTVWVSTNGSNIIIWNPKENHFFRSDLTDKISTKLQNARVNHLYQRNKLVFISTTIGLLLVDMEKNTIRRAELPKPTSSIFSSARYCTALDDGRFVLLTYSSLFLLEMEQDKLVVKPIEGLDTLESVENRHLMYDSSRKLLNILAKYGASAITLMYEGGGRFKYLRNTDYGRIGYQYFLKPNGNYWILSSEGLLEMNPGTGVIAREEIKGLVTEPVYFIGSNNSIGCWIVQKSRVSYYDFTTKKINKVIFLSDKITNQFAIHAANIELFQGTFAFGTTQGITTFNAVEASANPTSGSAYIQRVVKNDVKYFVNFRSNDGDTMVMDVDDKTIRFDVGSIRFNHDLDQELDYKLNGYDKEWIKTINEGTVRYTNLPAGNYEFMLREAGSGIIRQRITLVVQQPFWKTNWFLTLVLLASAAFIGWVANLRASQIRKEARLKANFENKMLLLEMQNLRSQMNPHFIFNSLNSINGFIIDSETRLASDYLTKFSRLVRLILENSKSESISLEKELEALKLYLLMEGLRFEEKFKYSIEVEDSIDMKHTKIPPMIIQPFAENAIWHGFMQKEGIGNLAISIHKSQAGLKIEIADDGIGRERATMLKSKQSTNTKSYGMQITKQRIQQLNPKNFVEIVDLAEGGNQTGTKIIIHLNL